MTEITTERTLNNARTEVLAIKGVTSCEYFPITKEQVIKAGGVHDGGFYTGDYFAFIVRIKAVPHKRYGLTIDIEQERSTELLLEQVRMTVNKH